MAKKPSTMVGMPAILEDGLDGVTGPVGGVLGEEDRRQQPERRADDDGDAGHQQRARDERQDAEQAATCEPTIRAGQELDEVDLGEEADGLTDEHTTMTTASGSYQRGRGEAELDDAFVRRRVERPGRCGVGATAIVA